MGWYRLLLLFYPAGFRAEYGAEMCAVHARRIAQSASVWSRLWLALAALRDVIPNAGAVHADLLRQDLRYTARTLGRSWGFALAVVFIVALGVGANTAAFSVADFVLLRPLPYPEPDRLIRVWSGTPGLSQVELSPANYRDWKEMNRTFAGLGALNQRPANLVADGAPQRLEGVRVTPDLLPLIGTKPLLGQHLPAESTAERRSLVISYALWKGRFAGDPAVLGKHVNLDGEPYVIVGVMPSGFFFPNRNVQFWMPLILTEADFEDRTDSYLEVVGRLRTGATVEQARADLTRVAAQLERQYPEENERVGATIYPLGDELSNRARMLLIGLCGAALCILLLACANLANLLLARAAQRQRELAVRSALGAGRERLIRQMITESLVLTIVGGSAGVLLGWIAVPMLAALVPSTLPIAGQPGLDMRVLLLAALITALTGLGFGVFPAWRAGSERAIAALREGARTVARGQRLRGVLVAVQVMASIVLVVTSGLLVRALWRVQQVESGFRTENVLTLRTALPFPGYDSVGKRELFYDAVLSRVRSLPGVSNAAYTSGLPMVMTGGIWGVTFPGRERDVAETASSRFVTPGYLATLGVPLRAGRDLEHTDRQGRPFVAVVSESFVKRYFPGQDPIGKRFRFGNQDREVVGVAGDIRVRGPERQSEPQVYMPHSQMLDGQSTYYAPRDLVIRTSVPQAALLPALQEIVRAADPAQPISDVRMLQTVIELQTESRTAQLNIVAALSIVALLLAAVGIHGLLSFTVSQRSREIGVRLALGARPYSLLRMVLREGLLLALAGIVPGLLLAYAAGRALSALLFGVQPTDPPTLIGAVTIALAMTLLGSLLPALRALRTDPLTVMRAD